MVLVDSLTYQPPKTIQGRTQRILWGRQGFLREDDEWIKMWDIHMNILFGIEKEENSVILMIWVDPEDIMLNEISQTEKDKHHIITYMWNFKKPNL